MSAATKGSEQSAQQLRAIVVMSSELICSFRNERARLIYAVYKCSGDAPACTYCRRTQRSCVYVDRPIRTPLTRKNLDAVEQKCERLTSLLRSLNPDVDIENLLKNGVPSASTPANNPSPKSPLLLDEASPGSSHEYEWHEAPLSTDDEQVHSLKDGMALLSTDPSSGYIGNGFRHVISCYALADDYVGSSAGSSMLQTIRSLLSLRGPLDEPTKNELSNLISKRQRSDSGVLMLEGDLTSSVITDGLIDAYFLLYNTSYPVLHNQLFRETYANRSSIPGNSSWQLILYTVLAIGHWVLSAGDDHADSPYYLAARSRMSAGMLESGTLAGVQAFLLMGNYLQKRDRPNTGYNMIGIAFRMALGLGLHREISPNDIEQNTLNKEIRRRVWWILYMVDSGFSITMGRPTTASDAFIDVRYPQNVDDSHLTSDELSSPLEPAVHRPTPYSAMIEQAKLAAVANKIYNEFLSAHISNAVISEELSHGFEEKLRLWRLALPEYFFDADCPSWFLGPRAVVLWKELNLRMILWRGGQRSYKTKSRSEMAVQKCLHVAIETVQAICNFCTSNGRLHQGLSWYAIYFLFQAVLVLDVGLLQAPEDALATTWKSAIEQARQCLTRLGTTNGAAIRCISVLNRIHTHHQTVASSSSREAVQTQDPELVGYADGTVSAGQGDYPMHQAYPADPALQLFLDGPPMNSLFDGLSGFPSTQEQQNFDYIPGDFYSMDDFDMSMNWNDNQF
ncbi:Regulatory protein GAL4 [Lachnellula suecica]|uniref:Regulatory protein GAL4 n=1 Tax=Lachnellula suecica TaxID=602035 RepID=A0A8T9CJG6_9HELO|nr:Regulatory protein GAL4 [Lachnellula suecica]